MDYIETVSVERLKKVIAGEQGGVSKKTLTGLAAVVLSTLN